MRRAGRGGLGVGALAFAAALVVARPVLPQAAHPSVPAVVRVAGQDRIATAVAVSERAFPAADVAVLGRADEFADALAGGPLAAALDGPLLLSAPDAVPASVEAELDRLGVDEVILLGGTSALSRAVERDLGRTRAVTRIAGSSRYGTASAIAEAVGVAAGAVVASGTSFPDGLAAGALAAAQGQPVLLVEEGSVPPETAALLRDTLPPNLTVVGGAASVSDEVLHALGEHGAAVERLAGSDRYATAAEVHRVAAGRGLVDPATTWLASGVDFADALAVGPAVAAAGGGLLLVDGGRLEGTPAPARRLLEVQDRLREVVLVGGGDVLAHDTEAQLDALLHGSRLPGGGRFLLPERRLVALYGSHFAPVMGVLGEQPPEHVAPRVDELVGPFEAESDRPVLRTFDVIATMATAEAGRDGLHRRRSTDEQVQRWLDAARASGAYLLLDLQPGRSDFLAEAQAYERFLREPDVGLALDPEWRTPPPAAPRAGHVGSVTAAELNAVTSWLSELVAAHRLPEKLVLVHHFHPDMVTDDPRIAHAAGVALAFQMDGYGGRGPKVANYHRLLQPAPSANGFMVFLDEDVDRLEPHELLQLDPAPDVISYQ